MDHDTSKGLILDYLYGEIDQEREAEFKHHVATCAACNAEVAALRKIISLYRSAPPLAAPVAAAQQALAAARLANGQRASAADSAAKVSPAHAKARFLFHPVLGIAAAFMVVAGILLVLPSSPDQAMKKWQTEMLEQPTRVRPNASQDGANSIRSQAAEGEQDAAALPEPQAAESSAAAQPIAHPAGANATEAGEIAARARRERPLPLRDRDEKREGAAEVTAAAAPHPPAPPPENASGAGQSADAPLARNEGGTGKDENHEIIETKKVLELTAVSSDSAAAFGRDLRNDHAGAGEAKKMTLPLAETAPPGASPPQTVMPLAKELNERSQPAKDLKGDAERESAQRQEAATTPVPAAKDGKIPAPPPRPTHHQAEQKRGRQVEEAVISRLAAEAEKALRGGEWARALALYEDLLARHPDPANEVKFLAGKARCEAKLQKPELAETMKRLEGLAPEQAAILHREFGKALKAGEVQRMAPALQAPAPATPLKIKRWHPTADDYERP